VPQVQDHLLEQTARAQDRSRPAGNEARLRAVHLPQACLDKLRAWGLS
jgi:hypothetical protein